MHAAFRKEGQRPQKKESLGVLVSKQGQEKISGDIPWHSDAAARVREVHVFSFPRGNQNNFIIILSINNNKWKGVRERDVQSHLTSWQAHLHFQLIKYSKLGQQPKAIKP